MSDQNKQPEAQSEIKSNHRRRIHWAFPLGIAAAGLGAVATVLLRGCWHRNMSWPIKYEHGEYSYQVCTDCGAKRLFDEKHFRPYGPYGRDVPELIAEVERRRAERVEKIRRMRQDVESGKQ
ncbi:MAG TPA: hypothetical protein VMU24_00910 [Candidatus Acidoferrales bacterium]|nr:hypothetical protein [Candidatus Acidoferrales bacterium]